MLLGNQRKCVFTAISTKLTLHQMNSVFTTISAKAKGKSGEKGIDICQCKMISSLSWYKGHMSCNKVTFILGFKKRAILFIM